MVDSNSVAEPKSEPLEPNYLRPGAGAGAGAEIIFFFNISNSKFGGC